MLRRIFNQISSKLSVDKYISSLSIPDLIFWCLVLLVWVKCAVLRFGMPGTPFIDRDVSGYLQPALIFFGGDELTPSLARGIYYPLFVWLNLVVGSSLTAISFTQHLLGLTGIVLIAFSFNSVMNNEHIFFKRMLILFGLIALGFNYDLIILEHTIRPEGLLLFLGGSIFFLLQKFWKQPQGASFILLELVLVITGLLVPKFALGGLFTGAIALYHYLKFYTPLRRQKLISIAITALIALVMLSTQHYFNQRDEKVTYFMSKNFFYVNSEIIQRSSAFKTHFSPDERDAINIAVKNKFTSPYFPLLGFDPDSAQYGLAARLIEGKSGTGIYEPVMMKALVHCLPALLSKAWHQTVTYYFSLGQIERIPFSSKLNYEDELEKSRIVMSAIKYQHSPICNKYTSEVDDILSRVRNYEPEDELYHYLVYAVAKLLSPFILVFLIFYSLGAAWNARQTLPLVLLLLHFLLLIPAAFIHTLDMSRYCTSLFPFLMFFFIPGIYFLFVALNKGFAHKPGFQLHWLATTTAIMVVLLVAYESAEYHFFDPYNQAYAPEINIPINKEANEVRIFVLGGSTTANLYLSEELRYSSLLEKKLARAWPGKKITVINAGMDWFTSKHSASLYITEYKKYSPDIIITLEGINDLYRSFSPEKFAAGPFKSDYSHFYGPSINGANPVSFIKFIYTNLLGSFIDKHIRHAEKKHLAADNFPSLSSFGYYMNSMVNSIKNDSVECIVLSQPSIYRDKMTKEEEQRCWFNRQFCINRVSFLNSEYPDVPSMKMALDSFNRLQQKIAINNHAIFIDADTAIPKNLQYFMDDVHLTTMANQKMAEFICKQMRGDSVVEHVVLKRQHLNRRPNR